MATVSIRCANCGKSVSPARAGSGPMICPACRAPVSASISASGDASKRPALPRPQPVARQSSTPSSAARHSGTAGSHRPATPGEALSGMSSGSWLPAPDPGPSPDAVNARTAPNRVHASGPDGANRAAQGSSWMRPPGIYYLGAGGAVIIGILLLVIVVALQKQPAKSSPELAASGGNVAIVTPSRASRAAGRFHLNA